MGMTLTEKIMARAANLPIVRPGEIVYPEADLATIHDLYVVEADTQLRALGVEKPWNPDRVFVCFDHDIIPQSVAVANRAKNIRDIVQRWEVKHFYGPGRGQGHIFPMEIGLVRPGMCVQAYDIHVTNYGAVGCLGISLVFEFPAVLAMGSHWYRVPETIQIELDGKFSPGVTIRDLAALIIRQIGPEQADYRVFEYTGAALESLGIDARVKLCNLPIEIGAKSAIIPADELVSNWFKERNLNPFDPIKSDPDANYFSLYQFDLSAVIPMVALPPLPDNVVPIEEAEGIPVHAAYLGSCAGDQYEDMAEAAAVLQGRKVAPGVRMIINPGSKEVAERCVREGIMEVFLEAGACMGPPGCGPCALGRGGPLADGEVCIATVTRNDTGRMGSRKAEIYLSSAATVAASAVAGKIFDPREFLN